MPNVHPVDIYISSDGETLSFKPKRGFAKVSGPQDIPWGRVEVRLYDSEAGAEAFCDGVTAADRDDILTAFTAAKGFGAALAWWTGEDADPDEALSYIDLRTKRRGGGPRKSAKGEKSRVR